MPAAAISLLFAGECLIGISLIAAAILVAQAYISAKVAEMAPKKKVLMNGYVIHGGIGIRINGCTVTGVDAREYAGRTIQVVLV